MNSIYKIKGAVQHYSWGGADFIPQLLGISNLDQKPFGEYWLGAHPKASAMLEEQNTTLDKFIATHVVETLGSSIAKEFGSLPYLFKVLDVKQMLSIQVHPSKETAEIEYERENAKAIPLSAPHRNYKDKNHKPELMVALSDFWLLHGFKKEEEMKAVLSRVPELGFLLPVFQQGGYKALYEEVMTMQQENVDEALSPLLNRIIPPYQGSELTKDNEDFWAARAALTFCANNQLDRGIFSIYLFNLLNLKEGEAIYQPAGLPHAYLEGQNVEVMANSDNVLRAGLTEKHIDVPELMKHVKFEATAPKIIGKEDSVEQCFDAPVREFQLKKYHIEAPVMLSPKSAAIAFVMEGKGKAAAGHESQIIDKGEAVLLLPGKDITVVPENDTITFFYVSAPVDKI